MNFTQSQTVYENLRNAIVFESEKNKLSYDVEIEPCYLIGNFGVRLDGEITPLERNAFRFKGGFSMCAMPETVTLTEIEKQGFPFFAGCLTVSKTYELADGDCQLELNRKGVNVVAVELNGNDAGTVMYKSNRIDGSHLLHPGENKVQLKLYNNLRNMMGPHHLQEGESFWVTPSSFFKEDCVWFSWKTGFWDEDYCFVETTVETEK